MKSVTSRARAAWVDRSLSLEAEEALGAVGGKPSPLGSVAGLGIEKMGETGRVFATLGTSQTLATLCLLILRDKISLVEGPLVSSSEALLVSPEWPFGGNDISMR